jgi:hypothetical protein
LTPWVNFTNILSAHFSYKSLLSSFFLHSLALNKLSYEMLMKLNPEGVLTSGIHQD